MQGCEPEDCRGLVDKLSPRHRTRYTRRMALNFLSMLPPWMTYIKGEAPIVLVAPHGGRRPADAPIRDSIKVNDVSKAERIALLDARTQSYATIHHALDRNATD